MLHTCEPVTRACHGRLPLSLQRLQAAEPLCNSACLSACRPKGSMHVAQLWADCAAAPVYASEPCKMGAGRSDCSLHLLGQMTGVSRSYMVEVQGSRAR